jgi:hypothetical protein
MTTPQFYKGAEVLVGPSSRDRDLLKATLRTT